MQANAFQYTCMFGQGTPLKSNTLIYTRRQKVSLLKLSAHVQKIVLRSYCITLQPGAPDYCEQNTLA